MTVPALRSLDAPFLNLMVTGPCVVGVHLMVYGCPAVTWMLPLMLNGLSDDWAETTAAMADRMVRGAKRILIRKVG